MRVSGTLLGRADFRETLAQGFGEALFNFRRDETDPVEVLDMDFVFQPEAGELHADQIGDGGDEDTFLGAYGL